MKAIGGFFRYGFTMCALGQHDLEQFPFNPFQDGISVTSDNVERIISHLSGGFKLKVDQIVMEDGLVVFRPRDDAWQVAFGEKEERYLQWMNDSHLGLTLDQYKKAKENS